MWPRLETWNEDVKHRKSRIINTTYFNFIPNILFHVINMNYYFNLAPNMLFILLLIRVFEMGVDAAVFTNTRWSFTWWILYFYQSIPIASCVQGWTDVCVCCPCDLPHMHNKCKQHTFIILLQMLQCNMTVFVTGLEISIRHRREKKFHGTAAVFSFMCMLTFVGKVNQQCDKWSDCWLVCST